MSDDLVLAALAASSFSLPHLRDGQLAGMAALAAGRDVLAVMPTGYGKSAIYQVAAQHLHNTKGRPAVVVSPLIALQEDQLEGLDGDLGPGAAVAVNSSRSDSEVEAAWQAVESGTATFLWTRPTASPPGATISAPTTSAWATSANSSAILPWPPLPPPHLPRSGTKSWSGCA